AREERVVLAAQTQRRDRNARQERLRARAPIIVVRAREAVQRRGQAFIELAERARAPDAFGIDVGGLAREAREQVQRLRLQALREERWVEAPDRPLQVP